MKNEKVNSAIAIAKDILTVGVPVPTNTLTLIYKQIQKKRMTKARDILLAEIRGGNFTNLDKDEFVSIIARYARDAMEGVARNNLKLLAKVIKGMSLKNKLKSFNFESSMG